MPTPRRAQPELSTEQLRLLPRLTTGAVIFYDEGILFCGNDRISGVNLGDLQGLVEAGLLLRLSRQAFELTSYGRMVAVEVPAD
jgi:hypothetical protein